MVREIRGFVVLCLMYLQHWPKYQMVNFNNFQTTRFWAVIPNNAMHVCRKKASLITTWLYTVFVRMEWCIEHGMLASANRVHKRDQKDPDPYTDRVQYLNLKLQKRMI